MSIKRRSFLGTILTAPFMLSWLKPSKAEKFVAQECNIDPTMYDVLDDKPPKEVCKIIKGLPNPEPIEGETVGEYAARKSAMMTHNQMDEMNVLHGCPERNRKYNRQPYAIVYNNRVLRKHFKLAIDDLRDLTNEQREELKSRLPRKARKSLQTEFIRVARRALEPALEPDDNIGGYVAYDLPPCGNIPTRSLPTDDIS